MLKKTIAALGLAAAASAAALTQSAYAATTAAPTGTTGTTGHVVSLGAFPTPLMVIHPMDDGSPSGGVGRE